MRLIERPQLSEYFIPTCTSAKWPAEDAAASLVPHKREHHVVQMGVFLPFKKEKLLFKHLILIIVIFQGIDCADSQDFYHHAEYVYFR